MISNYDTKGDYRLLGYQCIAEVSDGEVNEVIVGKYGYIYKYNKTLYGVVFWSAQVAGRYNIQITKGEEAGLIVSEATAKKIRKEIKTFRSKTQQLEMLLSQ